MHDIMLEHIIRKHLPDIAFLEAQKYEAMENLNYYGISAKAVEALLAQESTCGYVVTQNSKVIGYFVYSLHKDYAEIHNLVVQAGDSQQKAFALVAEKLKSQVNSGKRSCVYMNVLEDDIATLNLFKENGFRCIKVEENYFEDLKRDAFRMEYAKNKPKGKDGEQELVLV